MTALVTRDFLDRTGKYVLIPAGSKALGLAFKVSNAQTERMFVTFHRLIFPDGRNVYFPERQKLEGFNPEGALGSNATVKRHWFMKFGVAIAFGIVEGLAWSLSGDKVSTGNLSGNSMSAGQYGLQKTSERVDDVVKKLMDFYSNYAPIVSVKPGTRLKIYFSEDTLFSAYAVKGQ
jgi:type IV secretory pathway VirB10-like protein